MKTRKTYAVLGLGIFGTTLVKDLSKLGQDVVAIDKDMDAVDRVDEHCTAMCFDFTEIEHLKTAGVKDVDVGFVCVSSLEEAIIGILNLRELGVPHIIAKAKTKKHALALSKVGANEVYLPDEEIASRIAKRCVAGSHVLDLFDIGNGFAMFELKVKQDWVSKNLMELNFRSTYGLNVIAIKRKNETIINLDPKSPLQVEDTLLVAGQEDVFKRLQD